MVGFGRKILKTAIILCAGPILLIGAQSPNPRGNINTKNIRAHDAENNSIQRRSITPVITKTVSSRNHVSRSVVTARPSTVQRASIRSGRLNTDNSTKSRSAIKNSSGRSAISTTRQNTKKTSRASKSRATAIFDDVTKIGGGYAECRDSYATCMDQICANANDTYRRCFCSDRFTKLRETTDKLDSALTMLAEFQDNNLDAVDKTAAEVNAMYTATEGEKAIKKDTSESQKLLNSINDVLSGKLSTKTNQQSLTSLGVLDFSGFDTNDDMFNSNDSMFFGVNSIRSMANLEGKALYDTAAKRCAEISRDVCGSDAMFDLAKSSYSIMITQDCNVYEKSVNTKKASLEETVRTAEKYLREARLEEYRAHNSKDVNECLELVESAIQHPSVCGENYKRCLDRDTGLYINTATGEPQYTQALFGLTSLIVLDGTSDVLSANPKYDTFLDGKKPFAESALNSCRDISDTVWQEFKRSAIIQIAQAQDEKIQQVKDSCVMTIKECYDTQSGALKEMDTTEAQSTGAIAATAARGACYDKVQACAALYGDPDGCEYNAATNKLTAKQGKTCGLQALLTFVDTVDSVKVAEGCEVALTKYSKELCPDTVIEYDDGTEEVIPYGECRNKLSQVRAAMETQRKTFCRSDLVNDYDTNNTISELDAYNTEIMNRVIKDIYDKLGIAFTSGCEDEGGTWMFANEVRNPSPGALEQAFYRKYYGVTVTSIRQIEDFDLGELGYCMSASMQTQCQALGSYARYDAETNRCNIQNSWYVDMCTNVLNGRWNNNQCEITFAITD